MAKKEPTTTPETTPAADLNPNPGRPVAATGELPDAVREAFGLSAEQEAELAAAEQAQTPTEGAATPIEPAAAAPVAALPAAAVATTPAAEPPKPESIEELRERLAKAEGEREEWRGKALRERQRLRERPRTMPPASATPTSPAPPARIPLPAEAIELGDDGQWYVKPEYGQAMASRPAPPAPPAGQAATADPRAELADNYARMRADYLSTAEDPLAARAAIEEGEAAYAWLDQRVAEAVRETGISPSGMEGLVQFLEEEGLDKEFAAKYPGLELEALLEAPTSPRKLRRFGEQRVAARHPAPAVALVPSPAAAAGPTRASVARMGDRPRPMGAKGGAPPAGSSVERFANMDPLAVLRLKDDEIEEFDRALAEHT